MKLRCSAIFMSFLLLATAAWGADATVSVSSTPNTIKLGETKSFTITVAATGNLNLDQQPNPGSVRVYTDYVVNGGYDGSTF